MNKTPTIRETDEIDDDKSGLAASPSHNKDKGKPNNVNKTGNASSVNNTNEDDESESSIVSSQSSEAVIDAPHSFTSDNSIIYQSSEDSHTDSSLTESGYEVSLDN